MAIANILTEFGVISLANKALSPLMEPIYGLPGASIISIFTTYLSDNPPVLTLADDIRFRRYFRKYQLPALTNIGTSFGMGMIITVYMMGLPNPNGENFILVAIIGNIGAVVGSIVSVRLMLRNTKKIYGTEEEADISNDISYDIVEYREIQGGTMGERLMNTMLEGGASGVKVGVAIIPGALIICSIVMILTNGMPESGGYTGAAIDLIPNMVTTGLANANDVAVFTAMCMCWNGYLSTHVAMMDGLNFRSLPGSAIFAHTIGGACAGVAANWIFRLVTIFI